MIVKIHRISMAQLPAITRICLTMASFNHSFEYHTHCFNDEAVFNLTLMSNQLKIHCDEYKIVISDIVSNITITLQNEQYDMITIN